MPAAFASGSDWVPNGDYVIELHILKALGNPNNLDHWAERTSPTITIHRP